MARCRVGSTWSIKIWLARISEKRKRYRHEPSTWQYLVEIAHLEAMLGWGARKLDRAFSSLTGPKILELLQAQGGHSWKVTWLSNLYRHSIPEVKRTVGRWKFNPVMALGGGPSGEILTSLRVCPGKAFSEGWLYKPHEYTCSLLSVLTDKLSSACYPLPSWGSRQTLRGCLILTAMNPRP